MPDMAQWKGRGGYLGRVFFFFFLVIPPVGSEIGSITGDMVASSLTPRILETLKRQVDPEVLVASGGLAVFGWLSPPDKVEILEEGKGPT